MMQFIPSFIILKFPSLVQPAYLVICLWFAILGRNRMRVIGDNLLFLSKTFPQMSKKLSNHPVHVVSFEQIYIPVLAVLYTQKVVVLAE